MGRFVRIYLVPGAVFQSIIVGGGYGTGREVVEYSTSLGPHGGLLSLSVTFGVFFLVLAMTFELARRFQTYDYRAFFRLLLGRWWFLYEAIGALLMIITFAVLISAASTVLVDGFGLPAWIGIGFVFVMVATLEFFGREAVMRVLALWSVVLYGVFAAFLLQVFQSSGDSIAQTFSGPWVDSPWLRSGFLYAMYNITAIPIILYVARDFDKPRHVIGAALVGAVVAVVPALILHVAFTSAYPQIVSADVPVYWMMNLYAMAVLPLVFTVMLFGTLVETGAGVLQGVNERIDGYLLDTGRLTLGKWGHAGVAMVFMAFSAGVSGFGIKNLVDKGYGTLALGFLAIYFLPLLTVGVRRLWQSRGG